jgi:prophage regulatory protein
MQKSSHLPETGFVRLNQVIGPKGPLPISRSSWFAGVKEGRFPKPVALGPRTKGYRVEDIRALLAQLGGQSTEGGES